MSEAPLNHPSAEELWALSLGQLAEGELTRISAHLKDCPECCRRLDELDSNDPLLARLQQSAALPKDALVTPAQRRSAVRALRHGQEASAAAIQSGFQSPHFKDPKAVSQPAPRQVGDYDVLAEVGRGGMGVVYKAQHRSLHRLAALKMILAGEFTSPTQELRFRLEAELAARVQHPNIVQVYEIGSYQGRPFLALEWVEAGSLANRLDGMPWPAVAAAALIETLARAIHVAHGEGIVHRDLKPANILLQKVDGEKRKDGSDPMASSFILHASSFIPKIADFGLAQPTDGAQTLTQSGFLIGTPGYMAPEQASGKRALVGPATDIYALGVVLYELLTGQLPFRGDSTLEVLRAVTSEEPVRPRRLQPHLPRDLEAITLHCLEKEPAHRYPTALALAEDLERFRAGRQVVARPVGAAARLARACRRRPLITLLLTLLSASLLGGLAGVTWKWLEADEQRDRADANARQAIDEKREALFQTYRARIAAAVAALSVNDVADAARHLDAAPEALRDWEWRHLHSRLDDSIAMVRLQPGHRAVLLPAREGVRVGVFTGSGLRFTDESGNASAQRPFPDLSGEWLSVAGSAREWWLASADPGPPTLRDETGRILRTIDPPGNDLDRRSRVALSPDRTRLATLLFTNGAGAVIYDTSTGQELGRFVGDPGLNALVFSPDSRRLAVGGDGRVAHILDAATGKELARCRGHTSKILSIAFRGDGSRLLTASHDGTVRQWDTQTGREVAPPYDRHRAEVAAAVFSPDGQRVASAGADYTIRLWQAANRRDQAVLRGHSGVVTALAFSEDGRRLASAGFSQPDLPGDGTVRLWEAAPDATLPVLAGHTKDVYPVAYSPDGRWIASGSWDHTVRLWDAATGAACPPELAVPGTIMRVLAFTPDGTRLLSNGHDAVLVWDVATRRIERRLPYGKDVHSVAVSPDGTRVAVGASDPKVHFSMYISEISTGKMMGAGEGVPFAFSPDGTRLAGTDAERKNVVLWDAHTLRPVAHWQGHTAWIYALAFDRAGGRLVSASGDGTVRLWDVASGRCLHKFEGHTGEVFAAAFHPGGTRLATGGRDRGVWLWDLTRGEVVARLPGHTSFIWSLAFSPDGKTLVSGSGDFTVRLWDTAPLKNRYEARREAAVLQPEAKRLVEQLWRQKGDAAAVVESLRADRALGEPLSQAALREVMRRARPPQGTPGSPDDPP